MGFLRFTLPAIFISFFFSCKDSNSNSTADSLRNSSTSIDTSKQNTQLQLVEAKTFEVIDSLGKSHGWGYDLFVDGKKMIHQPIIPAIAGNNSFASEADAKKIGDLAAAKMKISGSLPTILVTDLDSLKIKIPK